MEIRFQAIRNDRNHQRNLHYSVIVDGNCIGTLKPDLKPNQKNPHWRVPFLVMQEFCQFDYGLSCDEILLRPMKTLIRKALIDQPDLSGMSAEDIPEYANQLHRDRTERKDFKRVKFHPVREDDSCFSGKGEYRISLDGQNLSEEHRGYFIRRILWDPSNQPLWTCSREIKDNLNLRCVTLLPFRKSKAVLRHILTHSINCDRIYTDDYLEMAEFARNLEIERQKLSSRTQKEKYHAV